MSQRAFTVELADSERVLTWKDVTSFQGKDVSGSFSLWAGHSDFVALCRSGVSRLERASGSVFIAAPSLLVEFEPKILYLSSRRIFSGDSEQQLLDQLQAWIDREAAVQATKADHLKHLEQAFITRLKQLSQEGV